MDTPDSFKKSMIETAKNSERVAEAMNKVSLATAKASDKEKEHAERLEKTETIIDQIVRSFTHMITMWATDALSDFWRRGLEYATQYYDLLNEIRIVTGATEEQASSLGSTYRSLAQQMSVSSSEIAKAAVEFWRQGIPEDEVNSRLVNTIQYAKISS